MAQQDVFDELVLKQSRDLSKNSLFLVPKNYKLQALQTYLVQQFNLQTRLKDSQLWYKDKVCVKLAGSKIELEGLVCQEYFLIRKLVYSHFGRM